MDGGADCAAPRLGRAADPPALAPAFPDDAAAG